MVEVRGGCDRVVGCSLLACREVTKQNRLVSRN